MDNYTYTRAVGTTPNRPYETDVNEKSQSSPLLTPSPSYEALPTTTTVPSPMPRGSRSKKICIRVTHFVVFLVGLLAFGPLFLKYFRSSMGQNMSDHSYGTSEPGNCVHRAQWTPHDTNTNLPGFPHRFRHRSDTSFTLPRSSDLLYFLSRGSLANGVIEFEDADNNSDNVKVEISIWYNAEDALDQVEVCTLQRDGDKNGVGIFTPHHWPHPPNEYRMQFAVKVLLPASQDYKDLDTDMALFVHTIDDLARTTKFRTVSFKTSNVPIHVKSLITKRTIASTSNGPIVGSFNASDFLSLHTSNSPIRVGVGLRNSGVPAKLDITTSNGAIVSNVTLISASESGTGGTFDVLTQTSNAPIDVTYASAPIDSKLNFVAHSSNSPVRASLDKTYEGTFSLRTTPWMRPTVGFENDVDDPAGRGRSRNVETHTIGRGSVEGHVEWVPGDGRRELGSVRISTSNSGIHLAL